MLSVLTHTHKIDIRKLWTVLDMIITLIVVITTHKINVCSSLYINYTTIKLLKKSQERSYDHYLDCGHHHAQNKCVQFFVYQLYHNKAVKKKPRKILNC